MAVESIEAAWLCRVSLIGQERHDKDLPGFNGCMVMQAQSLKHQDLIEVESPPTLYLLNFILGRNRDVEWPEKLI